MTKQIIQDNNCFCCGKQNSRGLQLDFRYPEDGKAETECVIPAHFTGWKRITHGGFLAMLLDEAMGHSCISQNTTAVTAEIQVRYLEPVEVGERIRVSARVVRVQSRLIETEADIRNETGKVVARASARFLKVQAK